MLDRIRNWIDEYRYMDYTFTDYLIRLVIPFTFLGIIALLAGLSFPQLFGKFRYLLYGFSGMLVIIGIIYPKIYASTKSKELEQNLHLFITHFGVLAQTGIERGEIFRILADKEEEYGPLSDVAEQINTLLNTWNQSMDEACRHVAERVPSETIADFLERMAHNIEAGQEIDDFIMDEQEVIMNDYESMYEDSLSSIMDIRDLFTSILLAVVFLVVFATLIPIISGISPLFLLGVAVAVFIASEAGFLLAAEFVLPDDPIWCDIDFTTDRDQNIGVGELVSIILSVGLLIFSALQLMFQIPFYPNPLPLAFYIGAPITPLMIPGIMTWMEETKTNDRDENFPNFLRSLGAISTARQTTAAKVLEGLRDKKFSELTNPIENLYKRLSTRIDRKEAWRTFSAETGSFLITKFSDMYYEGVSNGGDPKEISRIISNNFKRVLRIREERQSKANSILGLLYGMTGGVMIAIFIGYYLAVRMIDVVGSSMNERMAEIFSIGVYDIPGTHFLLLLMILLNAVIAGLFIRTVKDSHEVTTFVHAGLLVWIGILIAKVAKLGLDVFMTI